MGLALCLELGLALELEVELGLGLLLGREAERHSVGAELGAAAVFGLVVSAYA